MNMKRILGIILIIIGLFVVGLLIFYLTKDLRLSKEEKIVRDLTSMGENLYSEYYYLQISNGKTNEEVAEFLKKYETTGLKFNLTEMEKYSDEYKEKISNFKSKNKSCDKENTMIIIYPKSPYTKTDFFSEIKLDCGF